MRKTFLINAANKGYKLTFVVFMLTLSFLKWNFVLHFSEVIFIKTRSCARVLFIWKWIRSVLSFIWYEVNSNIFSLSSLVFPTDPIFLKSNVGVRVRFLYDFNWKLFQKLSIGDKFLALSLMVYFVYSFI